LLCSTLRLPQRPPIHPRIPYPPTIPLQKAAALPLVTSPPHRQRHLPSIQVINPHLTTVLSPTPTRSTNTLVLHSESTSPTHTPVFTQKKTAPNAVKYGTTLSKNLCSVHMSCELSWSRHQLPTINSITTPVHPWVLPIDAPST